MVNVYSEKCTLVPTYKLWHTYLQHLFGKEKTSMSGVYDMIQELKLIWKLTDEGG